MPADSLTREKVYTASRFDVVRMEVPRRGGGACAREVVVPHDAVVILPLLDTPGTPAPGTPAPGSPGPAPGNVGSTRVVLIRNQRHAVGQTLWELPAGTLEEGEDPDLCAERELIEETGYEAERLERLVSFYSSPGFCTEQLTAYVAHGLTHVGQDLDDTEQIQVEVVTLDEALAMARDNRIRDAKSLATLLHYHAFCREER